MYADYRCVVTEIPGISKKYEISLQYFILRNDPQPKRGFREKSGPPIYLAVHTYVYFVLSLRTSFVFLGGLILHSRREWKRKLFANQFRSESPSIFCCEARKKSGRFVFAEWHLICLSFFRAQPNEPSIFWIVMGWPYLHHPGSFNHSIFSISLNDIAKRLKWLWSNGSF